MKIFKIEAQNFRLLREFSIDVEEELSLIIGKNNTGKTSILSLLDKFLGGAERGKFTLDDLSIDFKNNLKSKVDAGELIGEKERIGVRLRIYIEYKEGDNLSNLSRVLMDLDPENNVVVLGFEYTIDFNSYNLLIKEYSEFKSQEERKKDIKEVDGKTYVPKSLDHFLKTKFNGYFKLRRYSLGYDTANKCIKENESLDLDAENISISDIINFKYINAKREVANKEPSKSLSNQTSRIYKKSESTIEQLDAISDFQDKLTETDVDLSEIYESLFKEIVEKVKVFGGTKIDESNIKIISTLQHRELLDGNTTVVYKHNPDSQLPESYNGLGYMNLISMIFEIEILVHEFKRVNDKKPADINLLFIEEPEAHTHPQMQYVFIKNIKKLLNSGISTSEGVWTLQYFISTHSAHIVADSDFNDIKYLRKDNDNVISKNLKDLKAEYDSETNQYNFLTQYLTISRAEIFFADKAILMEGDTERILIPTFMKKIDLEENRKYESSGEVDEQLPLLSQNISIVEVGAYCQIFEKFISFLGIKSLVITDIDAVKVDGQNTDGSDKIVACPVTEGSSTSNSAIQHFFNGKSWNHLKVAPIAEKTIILGDTEVLVTYQSDQNGYHGRSFEDAFISINKSYLESNLDSFVGIKNKRYFRDSTKDAYYLAEHCVNKKTHFAMDIIYNSNATFSNWEIPSYINEGLLWLKKD